MRALLYSRGKGSRVAFGRMSNMRSKAAPVPLQRRYGIPNFFSAIPARQLVHPRIGPNRDASVPPPAGRSARDRIALRFHREGVPFVPGDKAVSVFLAHDRQAGTAQE
jgi:hypothetical protein